ncbi:MAG: response regulator [Vicinamibacterales bacterium]
MTRIIIVEDNPIAASVFRATLAREGHTVTVVTDGEAGLAAIEQTHPDLVLLDLMLPKVSGLDVLRRMRATPELAHVPVIVTSNSYTSARLDELWQAGATQVITKASMTPKELVRIVRETLGQVAATQAL